MAFKYTQRPQIRIHYGGQCNYAVVLGNVILSAVEGSLLAYMKLEAERRSHDACGTGWEPLRALL